MPRGEEWYFYGTLALSLHVAAVHIWRMQISQKNTTSSPGHAWIGSNVQQAARVLYISIHCELLVSYIN